MPADTLTREGFEDAFRDALYERESSTAQFYAGGGRREDMSYCDSILAHDATQREEIADLRAWKGAHKDNAGKLIDAEAEVARLRALIEEAPHAPECDTRRDYGADEYHYGPCDCWKARARGGEE